MPPSWPERHRALLDAFGIEDNAECEDRLAVALDEHAVCAEAEIAKLRFGNKDLKLIGALESGQFASVEVVKCRLNNAVYVRKTTDKAMVRRCSQQCFPQTERDILLLATRSNTQSIPHLIASFHSSSSLFLVMQYASGGTLWDVLESSPTPPGISEADLRWWIPQAVTAISWCHEQGFCHRDIKPHNFAITTSGYLQLLDFASAAPFLPPKAASDYSRLIPGKYCLAPCGTCDYIAPEILRYFEDQVILFEAADSTQDSDEENARGDMSSESEEQYQDTVSHLLLKSKKRRDNEGSYGVEVDWWSLGVMIYELFYGVAPFFAQEIKQTYDKILNHKRHLHFPSEPSMSGDLKELIRGLLQDDKVRLGRRHSSEVKQMGWFEDVSWDELYHVPPPLSLHLPSFEYTDTAEDGFRRSLTHSRASSVEQGLQVSGLGFESFSRPIAFSQFFRSSAGTKFGETPARSGRGSLPRNKEIEKELAAFVGYTWGPQKDAFAYTYPEEGMAQSYPSTEGAWDPHATPRAHRPQVYVQGPNPFSPYPEDNQQAPTQTPHKNHPFATPIRRNATPYRSAPNTLLRTHNRVPSTVQRTFNGRPLASNYEAMDALLDVIGMSAQRRVLDSGRKPRSMKKVNGGFYGGSGWGKKGGGNGEMNGMGVPLGLRFKLGGLEGSRPRSRSRSRERGLDTLQEGEDSDSDVGFGGRLRGGWTASPEFDDDDDTTLSTLPSPSPTPRPGSALSTTLTFTRRSGTPSSGATGIMGSMGMGSMGATMMMGSGSMSSLRNGLPLPSTSSGVATSTGRERSASTSLSPPAITLSRPPSRAKAKTPTIQLQSPPPPRPKSSLGTDIEVNMSGRARSGSRGNAPTPIPVRLQNEGREGRARSHSESLVPPHPSSIFTLAPNARGTVRSSRGSSPAPAAAAIVSAKDIGRARSNSSLPNPYSNSNDTRSRSHKSSTGTSSSVSLTQEGFDIMEDRLTKLRKDVDAIMLGIREVKMMVGLEVPRT